MRPELLVTRLDPDLPLPAYQNEGDAGLDLHARTSAKIGPGERFLVGTGIAIAIPSGYVGLVTPRSGTAIKRGLSLVNTPGVIDSGYRGEVKLALINHDPDEPVSIERGDRIGQLLVVPVAHVTITEVSELPGSARGEGGFGSTGT